MAESTFLMIGQLAEYKGYIGSIEYDSEDKSYYGSLINTDDFVNYCADNIIKLQEEFHTSVDDYIEFCKELKEETKNNK